MVRIVLRLSRHVKRRIQRTMKKTKEADLRDRCRIVLFYNEGYGCVTIAKLVGCVPATAVRVVNRFLQYGEEGLEDRRKDNGCAKVDLDLLQALAEILGKSPQDYRYLRPTWTQELLALVLEQTTGVQVSPRTVGRMLSRLNARWGRPRPTVECPIPKATKMRKIRRIERLLEKLGRQDLAFFVDEVDIHLNPKIGPDWMLRGTQKWVLTPGINKKRYIAGALNAKTGEIVWVTSEKKNSELFVQLISKLRKLNPKAKRIHLILDNFVIHSSKRTEMAIASFQGLFVRHFLPPYSPDHNRIERLWKQLHDNVTRNHRCRTIESLMILVDAFLKRASPFPGAQPSVARLKETGAIRRKAS